MLHTETPVAMVRLKRLLRVTQLKGALAIVALSCLFFLATGLWTASRFASDNQHLLGRTIAYSVEAPLVFHDVWALEQVLQTFGKTEDIAYAKVYSPSNLLLSEYVTSSIIGDFEDALSRAFVAQPLILPITHKGEHFGYLHLAVRPGLLMKFLTAGVAFTLFAFVLCVWMSRVVSLKVQARIQRPLDVLSAATQEIASERRFTHRLPRSEIYEFDKLSNDINKLIEEVQRWQDTVEGEKALLEHNAMQDSLTGVGNRRHFDAVIDDLVQGAALAPFALLILDCDRFKNVNDQFGHAVGDQVLKYVAQRMRSMLRQNDQIFRIGGDEFAIVLKGVRKREDALRAVERFKSQIDGELSLPGEPSVQISISLGVGLFPDDGEAKHMLIKHADLNMYGAKQRGGLSLAQV